MILKRQKPRRLAGDKRGDGTGLLGNLVGDLVPPKPATDAPPSHDVETLMERDDEEEEEEKGEVKEEQKDNTPKPEADEPEQEQEVIAEEGDDEDQEHTLGDGGDQDPSSEDITNPSPSNIIEPTDTGSDPGLSSTTTTAEKPEPTPAPEEGHEDKDEEGQGQEPEPTPTPNEATTTTEDQPEPTITNDSAVATTDPAVSEPTDPAVAITSTITTTPNQPSSQMDPITTKASKGEEVGPTMLPEHKEETNGNQMALTAGVIVAALVIASPSRRFKSKTAGGSGAAGVVYGADSSGHGDRSEYNSYDEILRPDTYETGAPPMTSIMSTPAYPAAVVTGHDTIEYGHGYASYLQQQQSMGSDNYQQHHQQDYNHYGYDSGVPAPMPMSEASAMRTSVVSNSAPTVIGGVQATGHNIHGYGSEDYTQNDHFLRELRE
ncbi:hypothetical protein BGW39_000498 [Mortierella sp. 14UC]|nr:hypothetical protein BGW39_000498 [Mortierella sp. 14UC]